MAGGVVVLAEETRGLVGHPFNLLEFQLHMMHVLHHLVSLDFGLLEQRLQSFHLLVWSHLLWKFAGWLWGRSTGSWCAFSDCLLRLGLVLCLLVQELPLPHNKLEPFYLTFELISLFSPLLRQSLHLFV